MWLLTSDEIPEDNHSYLFFFYQDLLEYMESHLTINGKIQYIPIYRGFVN